MESHFLIGIFLKGKLFNNYVALIFAGALFLYLQGNFIINFLIWLIGICGILFIANRKWDLGDKGLNILQQCLH